MEMANKKTWQEFRESGLLWFINTSLHVFGWAIVLELAEFDEGNEEIVAIYPARVKFRGYPPEANEDGYTKLTDHLATTIDELQKDVHEEWEQDAL